MRQRTLWQRFIYPVTGYFRGRRGAFIRALYLDIQTMNVCDLGGSIHFWQNIGVQIPADRLTILNINESAMFAAADKETPRCKVVIYDGITIPFPDGHFDLLMCNSVIEHVPVERRTALAQEMMRVARRVFCQTPAFLFPIEPHFVMPGLHWLPKPIAYWFVFVSPWRLMSRPSKEVINSYFFGTNLLRRRDLKALFPTARIHTERMFGIPKSYYAISERSANS
jgi:Methyltransferase domain